MKKTIALFLTLSFCLLGCFSLIGCQKKTKEGTIRLNETTHSVFYAPLYVANYLGYFSDYGLTIEFTNGGGSDNSMTALISGGADIALLGPETAVYVKTQGSSNGAVIVGQLTQRDGSFLIGRKAEPNFKWADLRGKEIIGGRKSGMPAMCLEYAVNKNGLKNGKDLTINYDVSFDMITSAFESGIGDYCTMFEPSASQYESLGKGHIVASVGKETGNVAYTCFMVTQKYLTNNRERVSDFMKAVIKGINYCFTHTPEEIAEVIQPGFSTTDAELLVRSVKHYMEIEAWKTVPTMTEDSFDSLQNILLAAGSIGKKVGYGADIVDNSIVEEIIAGQL